MGETKAQKNKKNGNRVGVDNRPFRQSMQRNYPRKKPINKEQKGLF